MGRQPAPRVSSERLDPPVPRCGPTRQRLGLGSPTSHDASHGRPTAPTRAPLRPVRSTTSSAEAE